MQQSILNLIYIGGVMSKTDDIVDMLFSIVGDNVGNALKWLYGANTALDGIPMELIQSGKADKVYSYLHFNTYGPY
jgi:hypothetical protein